MTVAFTGGGTGGHIYPGLAVAEALRAAVPGVRIAWLGNEEGMDRGIVERAGIEFVGIPSGKFRRELSLKNLSDILKILRGYAAARKALKALEPDLLFSKGGFVSVPPCAAAKGLGIPVFTHESDATPGLATRLNARFAERIFTAYADTISCFKPPLAAKAERSGNPLRRSLFSGNAERGRRWLGFDGSRPLVLFVGGSQGARQINEIAAACREKLADACDIVHQTGKVEEAPREGRGYKPFAYIHDELPDVYAAADLVVTRSGAGSIWECGSLGKPMVLVPLASGATRGDQVLNARIFAKAGAALHLEGPAVEPEAVASLLRSLVTDRERLAAMSRAGRELCAGDAAALIAERIARRIQMRDTQSADGAAS